MKRSRLARVIVPVALAVGLTGGTAAPAGACAGLVTASGNVQVERTSTLAAYHNGIEHYITAFQFSGGGAEFGSLIPLPTIPFKIERGGDWTLQRLQRETQPQPEFAAAPASGRSDAKSAEEVYKTKVDSLDITVLRGGSRAVGQWAKEHGFKLSPDAPRVLHFYAQRSRIFMAAVFNADEAKGKGQQIGEATPVHIQMRTRNPWVPLRILGLGQQRTKRIDADVYLLNDRKPEMLPAPYEGLQLRQSGPASQSLLDDLRSDKGMGWVPSSMHLSYLRVNEVASKLKYDLAIDASGRRAPSRRMAGLPPRKASR